MKMLRMMMMMMLRMRWVEDEDDNAEDEVEDKNKPLKQADSALRMACVYWFSEIVKKNGSCTKPIVFDSSD